MAWVARRVLVPLVSASVLGAILTACSSSANGAIGTSGQADAFVIVDTSSPPIITVENRTGQPLLDVTLTIKSGMLAFTGSVSRLEANEKRPMKHGDLTSRDGTSFNLRVARPRDVAVTARNLDGKKFETTVPWR